MKFLVKLWLFLTNLFTPKSVSREKQAMLNVIKYIEDNPHMWRQDYWPTRDLNVPTCFGGLLLREMGIKSIHFGDLPMFDYLVDKAAFMSNRTLKELKQIVNEYR